MATYQASPIRNFKGTLAKAIDEALKAIFRNDAHDKILEIMAELQDVSYRDLLEDPCLLHNGLLLLFGDGSIVIESSILFNLSSLLEMGIDASEGFVEAISRVRLKLEFDLTDEEFDMMPCRIF